MSEIEFSIRNKISEIMRLGGRLRAICSAAGADEATYLRIWRWWAGKTNGLPLADAELLLSHFEKAENANREEAENV